MLRMAEDTEEFASSESDQPLEGEGGDWVKNLLNAMPDDAPRINVVEDDQFTEFQSRDVAALKREAANLKTVDEVDAHRYVITAEESQSIFENAARRHGEDLSKSGAAYGRRFAIAKGVGDPTYGTFRNAPPWPPRYCCFESFVTRREGWDGIEATTRWLAAIDRVMTGHPQAPQKMHVSGWARRFEGEVPGLHAEYAKGFSNWLVATEVLTAKYNSPAIEGLRETIIEHGKASLSSGHLLAFDVLQSLDSEVVFKTFEIYESIDALARHMETADPAFEKRVLPNRAAVNRVRQLYSPLVMKL